MSKPSWNEWVMQFALAVAATVLLVGCPPNIPAGTDCWETEEGTQQGLKIPENFFGPASDAIDTIVALEGYPDRPGWRDFVAAAYPEGCGCPEDVQVELVWVDRHGDPTDPTSKHAVKQVPDPDTATTPVDTCVYRSVETIWDGENVAVEVDIQLVGLSLKSVEPLVVTYHETTDPIPSSTKYFDLIVTQSATQPSGKMTLTPTDLQCNVAEGDVKLGELPVRWDVKFIEVDAGGVIVPGGIEKDLTDQPLNFAGTEGSFLRDVT